MQKRHDIRTHSRLAIRRLDRRAISVAYEMQHLPTAKRGALEAQQASHQIIQTRRALRGTSDQQRVKTFFQSQLRATHLARE